MSDQKRAWTLELEIQEYDKTRRVKHTLISTGIPHPQYDGAIIKWYDSEGTQVGVAANVLVTYHLKEDTEYDLG